MSHPHRTPEMTGVILMVTPPLKDICYCHGNDRIFSEKHHVVLRPQFILSGAPIRNHKDLICLLMVSLEDRDTTVE